MTGKVYLIGAGPGDPELLTVKALRLLQTADAVFHDDLVSSDILKLIPVQAQLRKVGKRCGKKNISQQEINFLMISYAALGMKVVRLKGGDPLIFGRLAEEIRALGNAGIPFEIVPGVTSAFGAAASIGIPLTDRYISPGLILLTAQRAHENEQIDWRGFISSGATLVIYMPGHHYPEAAARLLASGARRETSCAIVSRATTESQQTFITSVDALHRAPQLPAPTLLIVGDVVKFAMNPEWSPRSSPVATAAPEQFPREESVA
ncbi:MAG TPA: uroporphyrinogen-III C-methyltransferase [Terriglobales bacterium]|nr:uroporphyrinogen-III C-methyltransferase [Terriglobales bacterium]